MYLLSPSSLQFLSSTSLTSLILPPPPTSSLPPPPPYYSSTHLLLTTSLISSFTSLPPPLPHPFLHPPPPSLPPFLSLSPPPSRPSLPVSPEDDLLPLVCDALPSCPISSATLRRLWRQQLLQITTLSKHSLSHPKTTSKVVSMEVGRWGGGECWWLFSFFVLLPTCFAYLFVCLLA